MVHASRYQVSSRIPHQEFLGHNVTVTLAVAVCDAGTAVQGLSNAHWRINIPFLAHPQIAEKILQVPAFELAVDILKDDHWRYWSAKRGVSGIPGIGLVESLHIVLYHVLGDGEIECSELFAGVDVAS